MKVRLKREIVNLGVSNLSTSVRGQYVDPEQFVYVSFYFSILLESVFLTLSILTIGKFPYKNKLIILPSLVGLKRYKIKFLKNIGKKNFSKNNKVKS